MTKLNTLILGLAFAVGTTVASAQTKAVAEIPFDFTVSSVTLPAGSYTLQSANAAHDMLMIVNNETRKGTMVLAGATNASDTHQKGVIKFHRIGDRYFFSEVWTPAGLCAHAVPGKLERELVAFNHENEMASVSIPLTGAQ